MAVSPTIAAAREYFPRGLFQPRGSFRFSTDALLLAAFVLRHCLAQSRPTPILDLGCGCGVVGLACLLGESEATCLGVDMAPELVAAAEANAASLGMNERFVAQQVHLVIEEECAAIPQTAFSVVAANMPYRAPGSGRLPKNAVRRAALFAERETMPAFLRAARRALAPKGALALVYPWDGLGELLAGMEKQKLFPSFILPVATKGVTPGLCLVRAEKEAPAREAAVAAPLVLRGKDGVYTGEAASFCPWLLSRSWG
ncbi:methyltransferase domain-containing protein [Desulfovibrio sp. OttesenSCG-928-O18]|nr:methyltransferase domain-containing protein [Desulfovibrio sp. OttesenSCG-928-O18]